MDVIDKMEPTGETASVALQALERLLPVAEGLRNVEMDEDSDDPNVYMLEWLRASRIERAAPTFDQLTLDELTDVPEDEREAYAQKWLKVRVERMMRWMARWFGNFKGADAATIGAELERIARPFLLRIDALAANELLEAIAGLRRAESRKLLEELCNVGGSVSEKAQTLLTIPEEGR